MPQPRKEFFEHIIGVDVQEAIVLVKDQGVKHVFVTNFNGRDRLVTAPLPENWLCVAVDEKYKITEVFGWGDGDH